MVVGPFEFLILTLGLLAFGGISNPEGPTERAFSYM
jgi:hypothetical protein